MWRPNTWQSKHSFCHWSTFQLKMTFPECWLNNWKYELWINIDIFSWEVEICAGSEFLEYSLCSPAELVVGGYDFTWRQSLKIDLGSHVDPASIGYPEKVLGGDGCWQDVDTTYLARVVGGSLTLPTELELLAKVWYYPLSESCWREVDITHWARVGL